MLPQRELKLNSGCQGFKAQHIVCSRGNLGTSATPGTREPSLIQGGKGKTQNSDSTSLRRDSNSFVLQSPCQGALQATKLYVRAIAIRALDDLLLSPVEGLKAFSPPYHATPSAAAHWTTINLFGLQDLVRTRSCAANRRLARCHRGKGGLRRKSLPLPYRSATVLARA